MEGKVKAEIEISEKSDDSENVKYISNYNKSKHIKLVIGTISAKEQNKPNSDNIHKIQLYIYRNMEMFK